MKDEDHGRREDELLRACGELPTEISADRDLWPGIAARIGTPAATGNHSAVGSRAMLLRVAAAIALVVTSSLVTLWVTQPGAPAAPAGPFDLTRWHTAEAKFGPDYSLGKDYVRVRNDLLDALSVRLESLPTKTRLTVEQSLAEIHRAMYQINLALEQDPGNATLQRLLLTAYEGELALLLGTSRLVEGESVRTEI